MKTRKNKKFYNFTDKQKKRDRSLNTNNDSISKSWIQLINKKNRRICKHSLYLIVNVGLEDNGIPYENFPLGF